MTVNEVIIDWQSIYLSENPFVLEPPIDPSRLKWAGMTKLRHNLENVLREACCSDRGQLVLNRGVIGGGKTHASIYYSLPERMPDRRGDCVRELLSIRIQLPKEPANAVWQVYRQIVERLTLSQVRKNFKEIVQTMSEDDFLQRFRRTVGSEDLALALWILGSSDDEDIQALLSRYLLLSRYTATELKKLRIARGIDSLLDQTLMLAAIIESFIGIDPSTSPSKHSRVIIWIDEMEDLVYYSAREHRPLTQFIRDLIDHVPSFLTIFMNFTMTRPEREEEIDTILGGYLGRRITHAVRFDELTTGEAVEYVKELLELYRTGKQPPGMPSFYPFEESTLGELANRVKLMAPGYINKMCYDLIDLAFKERKLPAKDYLIDADFVREHAKSLGISQASEAARLL